MKAIWTAMAALLLSAGNSSAQPAPAPVPVDNFVLERHRIAGEPRIRVRGAPRDSSVSLELIIDESGEVESVRIDPDATDVSRAERGDRFLPAATAQLPAWRFRPFERGGKAVRARVRLDLDVVPPERAPRRRVPFPNAPPAEAAIEMMRSECFGSCPSYRVTVHGNGRVRFEGFAHVLVPGVHDYRIAPADAERLIARFRSSDFWSLDRRYRSSITDSQATLLTVRAGNRAKSVFDYVGDLVGMPMAVRALQQAVDETADVARFVGGNQRTLAALEGQGFDFRSPAAGALVLNSLRGAPEALTLELIERGAPLDLPVPVPVQGESGVPRSYRSAVLERAVAHRRGAVFDRLIGDPLALVLSQDELDGLLAQAARSRSAPIVRRLLELGARPAPPKASTSVLAGALRYVWIDPPPTAEEGLEVVRLLLARGAPLDATDSVGMTALQHAAYTGPEVVRLLVEAGADVDAGGAGSPPALYLTMDEDVALILIEAGADRTLRDEKGRTLGQIARRYDWRRVIAVLGPDAR